MFEAFFRYLTENRNGLVIGMLCFLAGVCLTVMFRLTRTICVAWFKATREKRNYLHEKRYQKRMSKRISALKITAKDLKRLSDHDREFVEVELCFETKRKLSKLQAYRLEKYIDRDFRYCDKVLGGWYPTTTNVNEFYSLIIIKEHWSFRFIHFSFLVGWIYLTDRDSRIFRYVNESFQDITQKNVVLIWYFYLRRKYRPGWRIIRKALEHIEDGKDIVWIKTFPEEDLINLLSDLGYTVCDKNEKTADNVSTWRKDVCINQ